jgi:hypothetical protein
VDDIPEVSSQWRSQMGVPLHPCHCQTTHGMCWNQNLGLYSQWEGVDIKSFLVSATLSKKVVFIATAMFTAVLM